MPETASTHLSPHPLEPHYRLIVSALMEGRLIPFLGAGVNLCGRPPDAQWQPGHPEYLPSGSELANHFVSKYGYLGGNKENLLQVAEYVSVFNGSTWLYADLHGIFNADYPPTIVHRFFAALPAAMRENLVPRTDDLLRRRNVLVTTNYDDVLERAFEAAGEVFHVVCYMADGRDAGKFLHHPPDGDPVVISAASCYTGLMDDQLPIILKIHGAIDRKDEERDSYVITEDHYIDYLTRTDITHLLPVPLPAKLLKSQFLFLGYRLQDWNLRAILHRIWRERTLSSKSWAVLRKDRDDIELEKHFWARRDIQILEESLENYFAGLTERLDQHFPNFSQRLKQ